MKKVAKMVVLFIVLGAISCLFYFTGDFLINNSMTVIQIIFSAFGICLTCYTFIIAVLNKAIDTYLKNNEDKREIIMQGRDNYLRSIKQNLLALFVSGVLAFLFINLALAEFMKGVSFNTFSFLFIFNFLLTLAVTLDTVVSIFKIVEISIQNK